MTSRRLVQRPVQGPLQRALGLLGELMITAGVLLGLFVVYSLWWTDVVADQRADADAASVRQSWSARPAAGPAARHARAAGPRAGGVGARGPDRRAG